jgi:hypothetical protein
LNNIKFTNFFGAGEMYAPTPASANIPSWYKNMESYAGGKKALDSEEEKSTATAKRCMPIFDAINSGYILYTDSDVIISRTETETGKTIPYYNWKKPTTVDFHPKWQLPEHPSDTGHISYPKWQNSWAIKTPSGYSCLFVQPFHRDSVFTILPGVVDTDKYNAPVNFPFVLNDINFEGLIPAGTPMAQVIPFKRDDWKMSVELNPTDVTDIIRSSKGISSKYFDGYKTLFRTKKEYR